MFSINTALGGIRYIGQQVYRCKNQLFGISLHGSSVAIKTGVLFMGHEDWCLYKTGVLFMVPYDGQTE